jgi:hypothetical protein
MFIFQSEVLLKLHPFNLSLLSDSEMKSFGLTLTTVYCERTLFTYLQIKIQSEFEAYQLCLVMSSK